MSSQESYEWGSFSLKGMVAIVTGGGSGIGKAICELFGKKGAIVELVDVNLDAGKAVADGIIKAGGAANASKVDVTDQKAVIAFAEDVMKRRGRIDVLVNNAGVSAIGTVEQCEEKDMEKVIAVNIKGVYNFCKAVAGPMQKNGGGSVVNLGSICSLAGLRDRFAYSMSKGAVFTMTQSMANDYVDKGIRVNCVCPARIHTPFVDGYLKKFYPGKEAEMFKKLSEYQPIGRMGQPKEVAALVLYLASKESSFCTGAAYPIDGGVTNLT